LKSLLDHILQRRAERLVSRMSPFLPSPGSVLDIGCGTGHNAATLRAHYPGAEIIEADVIDMKVVGPPPVLIGTKEWPFADRQFACGLVTFVLHYAVDPVALLREARRVVAHRLIVLQSTYVGWLALNVLRGREFIQGRGGLQFARWVGLIKAGECSLQPRSFLDPGRLQTLFEHSGWSIKCRLPKYWPLTRVSRDLYVLE
jgi:SAM-dependent methyltransferase